MQQCITFFGAKNNAKCNNAFSNAISNALLFKSNDWKSDVPHERDTRTIARTQTVEMRAPSSTPPVGIRMHSTFAH